MADVIKSFHSKEYTSVSLSHLKDVSLSNRAKGLLTLLLIQPDNEVVTIKYLSALSSDSEASIKAELKELNEKGYVFTDTEKDTIYAFEKPEEKKEFQLARKNEKKKEKEIEQKQKAEQKKEPVQWIKKVPYKQYKECLEMFQGILDVNVLEQSFGKELTEEFFKTIVLAYCAEGEVRLNKQVIVDSMVLKFKLKFMTTSEAYNILEKFKDKKDVSYPRQYLLTIIWDVINDVTEKEEN